MIEPYAVKVKVSRHPRVDEKLLLRHDIKRNFLLWQCPVGFWTLVEGCLVFGGIKVESDAFKIRERFQFFCSEKRSRNWIEQELPSHPFVLICFRQNFERLLKKLGGASCATHSEPCAIVFVRSTSSINSVAHHGANE